MVGGDLRLQVAFDEWLSFESYILRLSLVQARIVAILVIGLNVVAAPAMAQGSPIDEVGDAMCGTGIGDLVALLLAAISMYLIVKAGIRATMAFDKLGEARSETQFEGKKQLAGAGKTLGGAFVPVAFGGILEVVGMNTVSCLSFDIGLMMSSLLF
ncbi:hypothetical protein SAMN05216559_3634 [Halomicrobium zhouii]|uniref:Uncharacterized protein n=1 Tax=Halomicrobium zhouii TaxID=767519 RepID=A0A1I6M2V0_9EURY|nr:hypothetical protein [Halomicrobium zhouii]SFS09983.1 hypothetical protein SAMN05216559_3634 [Halomicrobium zhouii]